MTELERLAYFVQLGYFVIPTAVGAGVGWAWRRDGQGAGLGGAAGFVLGATAYAAMSIFS